MMRVPIPENETTITVRPATHADATALANLATQLGYPSSPDEVEARLSAVLNDPKHLVLVAQRADRVAGWAHAYAVCLVESDPHVELGGLVVDASVRDRGIGKQLLAAVESWASQKGCRTVSVRSNVIRQRAHAFYAAQGYAEIKTQKVFRKDF